jgi:acetolactate synthase-1/2/3 large subunit
MSDWVRRVAGPDDVAPAAQAAIDAAATLRGVATLILPADASWGDAATDGVITPVATSRRQVDEATVRRVAADLRSKGSRAGILVGQYAAFGGALDDAARVAAATGARLLTEGLVARAGRGRGRPLTTGIPYRIDAARAALAGLELLVTVGAREPVAFFAYPGKPNRLVPDDCAIVTLAGQGDDQAGALAALVDELDAGGALVPRGEGLPATPAISGKLTGDAIAEALAFQLPEDAIVVCESPTLAARFEQMAVSAAPHDFIFATVGGAIGDGIPVATGAAVGAPGRKVVTLQPDGSGMYTVQGLWTQAREGLDVLTIVLANRAYAILAFEMRNLGLGEPQANARRMMEIDHPSLDWVALAKGMGVEAAKAETAERFRDVLAAALRRRGPFLIECAI